MSKNELTADEIAAEREKLVKKILAKEKLLADIDKIKKTLKFDFEEREMEYRYGIKTPAGILYRKPKFELSAAKLAIIEE